MRKIVVIIMAALALVSCNGKGGKRILPNISGKAGEVLVVIEKSDWEAAPGIILRDSLTADCPFLAMKEPLYNLTNVNHANFNQMFQIHRNIITVNVSSQVQSGVTYKKNKWAKPQIVIGITANSQEQACELLSANMHDIINVLEQTERDRVVENTRQYQESKLAVIPKSMTGGTMLFPSGWSLKKQNDEFQWFSYETTYVQQGIFVYKYPAEGVKSELTTDAIIARRNEVLKVQVPGMVEGSYMTTSEFFKPLLKYVSFKGRKFVEIHGLWDVAGDFMGGPFVSHTFYTPDGKYLVCLEGYVYAPKYDKRLYLRQVESLLYSFEFPESNAGVVTAESK